MTKKEKRKEQEALTERPREPSARVSGAPSERQEARTGRIKKRFPLQRKSSKFTS